MPMSDQKRNRFLLEGLNVSQQEAVTQGEGPVLVLAGPGSGKTTVIVRRIYYIIQNFKVPPEQILVVTFTKDAAISMQQRFLQFSDSSYSVCFGTFHSIFYQMLKQSHFFARDVSLLDTSQKLQIMQTILKDYYTRRMQAYNREQLKEEADMLLHVFEFYKNTSSRERAQQFCTPAFLTSWLNLFDQYGKYCRQKKLLDYDDMIFLCNQMFSQRKDLQNYWRQRFRYLCVDEFQDINPAQYEMLSVLSGPNQNLFAVGDDDQSIYGFRGAGPECMRRFVQETAARRIVLSTNYRSCSEIISFAKQVISENRNRFPKNYQPAVGESREGGVKLHCFSSREKQLQWLAEIMLTKVYSNNQVKSAESKETIGILFRTRSSMRFCANVFAAKGIPFAIREKLDKPCEHFIFQDIYAYLKLAKGEGNRNDLLRILNKPDRKIQREEVVTGEYSSKLKNFLKQIQKMQEMGIRLSVEYIIKVLGYETYLKQRAEREKQQEEWNQMLQLIREYAKTCKDSEELRKHMAEMPSHKDSICNISLMTVHAAKGLEFDRVYLPDCNEKIYPYGVMHEKEALEEERRIFYVAVTRAKKNLELLTVTGTAERPRQMSRFLPMDLLKPKSILHQ